MSCPCLNVELWCTELYKRLAILQSRTSTSSIDSTVSQPTLTLLYYFFMEQTPIGAIASVSSFNGKHLKVVVVGEGGTMLDVNCRFGHDRPKNASLPNYLSLPDGRRTQGSLWTDRGVIDTAHPNSKLAVCTIERLDLACFFYQLPNGSIVMRRCMMGSEWKWEDEYVSVLSGDSENPATLGTSIVVQPSVLRAGDNSKLTLFYQTASGHIGIQKVTESGELQGPIFRGRLSLPRCTPFTALTSGNDFTISYITLETQEIWECSGSLADGPWRELEDDESYISAAQRVVLKTPPTPYCVQMASYQTEQPIFYSMVSSKIESIVWSSSRARRSYRFEVRGMPGTPIALSGHSPMWSSLSVFFVDINGAVNVGRLGSGSADGTKEPECFPIPLDSMRNAFSWALSKQTGCALGLDISPAAEVSDLSIDAPDVPAEADVYHVPCETDQIEVETAESTEVVLDCLDPVCEETPECAQPCPEPCSEPCADPCPEAEEAECDGITEECNGAGDDFAAENEYCGDEPVICEAEYSPCGEAEVITCCPEETEPNGEDEQLHCEGKEEICEDPSPCDENEPPCGEGEVVCAENTHEVVSNEVEGESDYGICSTCDGNESEAVCPESPSDEDCDTVIGDGQDVCEQPDPSPSFDEPGIDNAPFDDPALSEQSATPIGPAEIPLPEPTVCPLDDEVLPTNPSPAPASPISDIPCLPELPEPVQEAPIVDTDRSFVDIIYDRLRFTFKPSGGRYISLQLPTRRLDQVFSRCMGNASTCSGFDSTMISEANFKLSDELFDVAKFVSGPNGKSVSREYEKLLYSLIPNPDTDVNKRLNTQRSIIRKYLLKNLDHGATSAGFIDYSVPKQAVDTLQSETRQTVSSDKSTRIILESAVPRPWDVTARFNLANDITQSTITSPTQPNIGTGPAVCGVTRIKPLSYPNTAYAQDICPPARPVFTGECFTAVCSNIFDGQRAHAEEELLTYLDVKTSSELLYDAKVIFRKSGRRCLDVSGFALPVTIRPMDWYEASQTSWGADELNQDLGVLRSQLNQKLSDMDSLTAQLIPFVRPAAEDYQELELEVESLIKERDGLQRDLESEYPASIIAASQSHNIKISGVDDCFANLLGCVHSASPSEHDGSGFNLDSVAERLNALKTIDRKLLSATRSLSIKRARGTMAKSDGPNMQMRSMLESKILEQQAFIEAHMNYMQLSSERYALNLQTSIAQVHLPHSNDPRWSIVNISTEVPNMTWEDPAVGFGLWAGYESSPSSSAEAVKLDLSFRVSLVDIDRGAWFKSEFMEHASQFMRLPGSARWSEWPCDAQAPEDVVTRILQGDFESKGSLPALPTGYLVAKDVLIKIHTPEKARGVTKQDLIKQAAAAHGILCFGFAPQASSHGNAAAMHINEYSDGIVFRIPEAQILGYMMQLTPPDSSIEYNAELVESNIETIIERVQYTEQTPDKTGACTCNQNA
ncbi:unnamed protein product [Rhizoctonia solani]|uniref:Uncharacterized protein n=1 Tax=Rhizoctonia solani TaxID=456999 RepID=A0A8H2WDN5_9AGAM|nr:unnamed protein product [Rhizoctonia solani]